MGLLKRATPLQKEWEKLESQEQKFYQKRKGKKDSILNQKLEDKVPPKLQETLDAAFIKAFALIFEKGTGVIEKTYQREKLEQDYQVRQYASEVKQDNEIPAFLFKKSKGYRDKELTVVRSRRDRNGYIGDWYSGYSGICRNDLKEYI